MKRRTMTTRPNAKAPAKRKTMTTKESVETASAGTGTGHSRGAREIVRSVKETVLSHGAKATVRAASRNAIVVLVREIRAPIEIDQTEAPRIARAMTLT